MLGDQQFNTRIPDARGAGPVEDSKRTIPKTQAQSCVGGEPLKWGE